MLNLLRGVPVTQALMVHEKSVSCFPAATELTVTQYPEMEPGPYCG